MTASVEAAEPGNTGGKRLHRAVGYRGLMLVSLGSIIGSGWLLGALKAAKVAGPASLLSWILAAVILTVLALIHSELGAAYPVAGGTARFPRFAFGDLAGFVAGWSAWLQAVAIAPIEVEASLSYVNSIGWVKNHLHLLDDNGSLTFTTGIPIASALLLVFLLINIVGVKFLSESNSITMIWKTAIPILTVVVLVSLTFHPGNFSAGGGFMAKGMSGVFSALPVGVVFALQGFEQAIQIGGEARNPQKDLPRAILTAVAIGTLIYIALEVAFIGGLDPAAVAHGWDNPIAKGDYGPYATLATVAGAGWLAWLLYTDAVVSPAGTGLVYLGTSARLTYALGKDKQLPKGLAKLNVRGVPVWSLLLAFVFGEILFLPFPSWQSMVGAVTSATAFMYAFAPISLAVLRKRDGGRERPYRLPAPQVLAPIGFIAANLIVYWGGFDVTVVIVGAIVIGFVIFLLTRAFSSSEGKGPIEWKAAGWLVPWIAGTLVLGYLGDYGGDTFKALSPIKLIPQGAFQWDSIAVAVFSLVIFYVAVNMGMTTEKVNAAVDQDKAELAVAPELTTA